MDISKMKEKRHALAFIFLGVVLVIVLSFVKIDTDNKDEFLCHAVSENPEMDMSECPVHNSNSSWLLTFAFGVAFLLIGVGIHMAASKASRDAEGKIQNASIDMSKMSADERTIVELLQAHEGSMYQSDLIKATSFSKVQITRILDKLEHNHVIDRKRRGMTNIVVLK